MYNPQPFAVTDRSVILDVLRTVAFGHLVTASGDASPDSGLSGLSATALPFVVDDDLTSARAHFSRANGHWRLIDGRRGLLIVPAADAYVSPRWYPSKAEHGKVVPTWNYELIHLHGAVEIHDDRHWKCSLVEALTDQHERRMGEVDRSGEPWRVDDAPEDFVAKQLQAIVGVELRIERIEAKQKLSQNRPETDRLGAMAGLAGSPEPRAAAVAKRMGETDGSKAAAD